MDPKYTFPSIELVLEFAYRSEATRRAIRRHPVCIPAPDIELSPLYNDYLRTLPIVTTTVALGHQNSCHLCHFESTFEAVPSERSDGPINHIPGAGSNPPTQTKPPTDMQTGSLIAVGSQDARGKQRIPAYLEKGTPAALTGCGLSGSLDDPLAWNRLTFTEDLHPRRPALDIERELAWS